MPWGAQVSLWGQMGREDSSSGKALMVPEESTEGKQEMAAPRFSSIQQPAGVPGAES